VSDSGKDTQASYSICYRSRQKVTEPSVEINLGFDNQLAPEEHRTNSERRCPNLRHLRDSSFCRWSYSVSHVLYQKAEIYELPAV
jgi:hypothetical protein